MMKYYVGVDLGGTNIVVGIVDEDCNIIYKKSVKTRGELPFEIVVRNIGELINRTI